MIYTQRVNGYQFLFFTLGANFFLQPGYNDGVCGIDDSSQRNFSLWQRLKFSWVIRSTALSIKEIQLYRYNKNKPFKKLPSNIFQLKQSCLSRRECIIPEIPSRNTNTSSCVYQMQVLI